MRRIIFAFGLYPLIITVSGCSTAPVDRNLAFVQDAVSERTGASPMWPTTSQARAAINLRVNELLQEPIDSDRAVMIALLNNRMLRVELARLGFAEADYIEAGLLDNPSLSAGVGFPDRPPSATELDFGLTMNLLRVLVMPASKEIAQVRLDSETLGVADTAMESVAQTRSVFLDLQASMNMMSVLREIARAAEISAEFAERTYKAGNLSELALANEKALYEQTRMEYAMSLAQVAENRERLNVQLGLWGEQTTWTINDRLAELPQSEPDLGELELLAVHQRLDLAAAAKQVETIAKAAGLQRDWRYLLTSEVGFNAVRSSDSQWVYGPAISLEIPILDQHQAEIMRLDSALLEAQAKLEAIAIQARSDVRRLRDKLYATRYQVEHLRDTIIPLREQITELTQQQYNFMLSDTFDLLAAKRDGIAAYRDYLSSVRDYWAVRIELERAVGGRLPDHEGGSDSPMPEMKSTTQPTTQSTTQPAEMNQPSHDHGGH